MLFLFCQLFATFTRPKSSYHNTKRQQGRSLEVMYDTSQSRERICYYSHKRYHSLKGLSYCIAATKTSKAKAETPQVILCFENNDIDQNTELHVFDGGQLFDKRSNGTISSARRKSEASSESRSPWTTATSASSIRVGRSSRITFPQCCPSEHQHSHRKPILMAWKRSTQSQSNHFGEKPSYYLYPIRGS